jgi:hypothetical protein
VGGYSAFIAKPIMKISTYSIISNVHIAAADPVNGAALLGHALPQLCYVPLLYIQTKHPFFKSHRKSIPFL